MGKGRKYACVVLAGTPPENTSGKNDKVGVFVKRVGSQKYERFFVRLTHVDLNGTSAEVFGRPHKDDSDRKIEVAEIIFRRKEDLEELVSFDLKRRTLDHYLEHPCVKVDELKFAKGY